MYRRAIAKQQVVILCRQCGEETLLEASDSGICEKCQQKEELGDTIETELASEDEKDVESLN